jgi:protein arginine N-methyltransferase 1
MQSRDRLFEYHLDMLADRARLDAFDRAIRAAVKPGDVVVDLGCGTGILSLFACRAGARHVYALDDGEVGALAHEVFRANGVADRVTLIRKRSTQALAPERADVLIGYVAPAEGMLSSFIDARARWLKPWSNVIPARVQIVAAPASCASDHARIAGTWSHDIHGFDYTPLQRMAVQQRYALSRRPESLLAQPASVLDMDLARVETPFVVGTTSFPIASRGVLHGLYGTLRIELAPGIVISGHPPDEIPSLGYLLLPLPTPVQAEEGDVLEVRISIYDGQIWRWETRLQRGSAMAFSADQSTFHGFPLDLDRVRVHAGDRPTALSDLGRAAEAVLADFSRGQRLDEIVAGLASTRRDLFPTLAAARTFVVQLAERFARGLDPANTGGS